MHKKILKIYNTTIFIILRINCLPKCIINHIIVHFCNKPLMILRLKYLKNASNEKNAYFEKLYTIYCQNRTYNIPHYIIDRKCLIIDHIWQNIYIDTKFSAHPDLYLYKLEKVEASDENILINTKIILSLFEITDFYESFYLPVFPNHLLAIFQKNKDLITKVMRAKKLYN